MRLFSLIIAILFNLSCFVFSGHFILTALRQGEGDVALVGLMCGCIGIHFYYILLCTRAEYILMQELHQYMEDLFEPKRQGDVVAEVTITIEPFERGFISIRMIEQCTYQWARSKVPDDVPVVVRRLDAVQTRERRAHINVKWVRRSK